MENPEGVLNLLDEFAKLKSKEIPNDLEEYLLYVAASGDPVYQWSLIKTLYRQKLINVITEFYETCPMMDIPPCPNVDPFNYETMKNSLLDRLDSFSSAPFTIQRISELLTNPRKQYNRVDKFMRAIEKNIWVVSTREPGQREAPVTQENSSNLVNGVAPRVHVTVKHPKRGKSIEERIKSGHPQLIDDDDEEEEDEEQMEVENNAELIANNETDDTPLQCTSVKDLIEKYENGTIFSNAEEKTEFEEKSGLIEETATNAAAALATVEDSSEKENESTDSDNSSSEQEGGEEDGEDPSLEKIIPTEPIVQIESILPNEEIKDDDSEKESSANEAEVPTKTETEPEPDLEQEEEPEQEQEQEPLIENPKDDTNFEESESAEDFYKEETKIDEQTEENLNLHEQSTSVTEITETETELENNGDQETLEEINSEEAANVIEPVQEKEENADGEETEEKVLQNPETEVDEEKEAVIEPVPEKTEAEDTSKLATESRTILELESDWSSSPDNANIVPPVLRETLNFIDVKEPLFEKDEEKKEPVEIVTEETEKQIEQIEALPETCTEIPPLNAAESSETEAVEKSTEYTAIEAELSLQNEILDTKMDENDLEEKSNEMIVEENDKIDEMEVDDSCTNSPMAQEEILEPMDDSDAGHS